MRCAVVGFPRTPTFLLLTASVTLLAPAFSPSAMQAGAQDLPTIREKTAQMESQGGFIPIHYDPVEGRLYLEVSLPSQAFLYNSLMASDAGLVFSPGAPNWQACERILRFERRGAYATLVRVDLGDEELSSGNPEVSALLEPLVQDFLSVPFPIVAEEEGRVLLEATDHFVRDLFDVPGRFASLFSDESFRFDPDRSSIYGPRTRATPESTEIEVSLAFVSDHPGEVTSEFLSDPTHFVARERHSLVKLPLPGFERRQADPRMGFMGPAVVRRRLEKVDRSQTQSAVVDPIVFYVDPALPASLRAATERGLGYWTSVLAKLGFQDAIQVQELPLGGDPLSPEFPIVVLWRPAGMSSTGFPLKDPRTGEIVKAVISLDGHEEALDSNRFGAYRPALEPGQPDLEAFKMAMYGWVVAHEAGHVLAGMPHNNIVPSVMGMRRPRLRVGPSGGLEIDLSVVDPPEPFPYDVWMMGYAYREFDPGEEEEGLRRIVEDGLRAGLRYADNQALLMNPRAAGRIHSDDPLTVLEEDMAVRRLLLEHFGPDVLHSGEPNSLLFERLIPVYFHHRHSLKAVATMLGGVDFTYDSMQGLRRVETVIDSSDQRSALDAVLEALSPKELLIPSTVAEIIPARLESSPLSELEWPVRTPGIFLYIANTTPLPLPLQEEGPFDPLGWARVLTDMLVADLTDAERLARVAGQNATGQSDLSVMEVLNRTVEATWGISTTDDSTLALLGRTAQLSVLDRLVDMVQDDDLPRNVREQVTETLESLLEDLREREPVDPAEDAHLERAIQRIVEALSRGAKPS